MAEMRNQLKNLKELKKMACLKERGQKAQRIYRSN